MASTSADLKRSVRYLPDSGDFAEEGKYYEQKVTAFISLEALNNTDDFCLISNPPKCAPLDDIILCTQTNKQNTIYLFQVKSKLNPTAIIDDEFKFESFSKDNKKIKSKLHIEGLYKRYPKALGEITRVIPEKYAESSEVKIVIFTNRPIEENSELLELLDSSMFSASQGKIYKFKTDYIKGIIAKDTAKQSFLQSILVFAAQSDIDIANTSINRIKGYFNSGRDIAEAIKYEYYNCVKNWCEIKSEKESLTKEFIYKLFTYSTLKNFAVPLEEYDERAYKKYQEVLAEDSFGLLWESIKNKNLSVSPEHKNYILGNALEDFQRLNIEAKEYEQIICNDELKRTDKKKQLEYYIGFLLGKLPLVVQDFNLALKMELEFLKIVTITCDAQNNWLKINKNIRNEIKQIRVTTRSNQTFKVEDIINGLSNEASISDVLNLIIESRNKKNDDEILISRKINRIFLDPAIFSDEIHTKELFIINTNLTKSEFIAWSGVNEENILAFPDRNEIMLYLYLYVAKYKYILINEDIANVKKSRSVNIHFLNCFKVERFSKDSKIEVEWIKSNGSVDGIKKFRCNSLCNKIQTEISGKYVFEDCLCCMALKEICINIQNPFIIITGVPGAGKTKLLKQFAQIAPTNDFILFIALKDHYNYYESVTKSESAKEHLNYFYKKECKLLNDFFVNKFITKNIIILFDAFDEIAPKYTNTVSEIVKKIREANYKIIMTTRSVLKQTVEDKFQTFSFSLNLFYRVDQENYLEAYHKSNISTLSNDTFLKIVEDNMPSDIQFCKVPVNLHLIADVIYNDLDLKKVEEDSYELDNLKLYERFINYRMGVYSQKINNKNISNSNILSYHKYCSIKLLFNKLPIYEVIGTFLDIKLHDYFKNFKEGNDKVGILIEDVNEIILIHRTVAEYLAAEWLLDMCNATIPTNNSQFSQATKKFAKDVIKMLIFPQTFVTEAITDNNKDYEEANFPVVKLFLNLMINKSKLHKAALKGDYELLNEIIDSDIETLHSVNNFNRTILHTLILNNTQFYDSWTLDVYQELIKVIKLFLSNCNYLLTQKDSLQLSVQDYAKQKNVNRPFLKIVIHQSDDECYVYFNRDFQLWEIFCPENLCDCNIYQLLDVLQAVPNNKVSQILEAAIKGNLELIRQFYNKERIEGSLEFYNKRRPLDITDALQVRQNTNLSQILEASLRGNLEFIQKPFDDTYYEFKTSNGFSTKRTSITHYSVISGNIELIYYLNEIKLLNFSTYDSVGFSAFHYAIIFNKIDVVKYYLSEGFDINFSTNWPAYTPLQLAAAFSNKEIFEFLLEKGADINCKTEDGSTLLHLCTWINSYFKQDRSITDVRNYDERCFDFVTLLLDKGLDINAKTQYATPLINAVYNNNKTLTNFLIENSADVNVTNDLRCTALHAAAYKQNIEILKLLLEYNADIDAVDYENNSILHYALHNYAGKMDLETVVLLIEKGANSNAANVEGKTPLQVATYGRFLDELKFFIEHTNVNINAQDNDGNTALHYAAYWSLGSNVIVKYLIDNNADVNVLNKRNQTPLDVAIVGNNKEIELILKNENGISKNTTDKDKPKHISDLGYRLYDINRKQDMEQFIHHYSHYYHYLNLFN